MDEPEPTTWAADEAAAVDAILADLTPPQREAVMHMEGPALVLAGPGSGKTRIITRRVAHLIANGVPAWSILALTFTNKAAGEMRHRIESIVAPDVPGRRGLTVTTFHSLGARLLRRYAQQAGIPETYSIYDASDQRSAIKEALKRAKMDSKHWTPANVHTHISHAKNQLLDAEAYAAQAHDFFTRMIAKAYTAYDEILRAADALDFDDLLVKLARLLREDERVREELQERYQYLLIDEYQDTNHVQFVIAHTLAAKHRNILVVGDPDQSVYGWRGADIRNILDFERHYADARVIPLGQNFRSTQHIVRTADGLIRNNRQRKHKDLFAETEEGEKPTVCIVRDERHEATVIADELQRRHDEEGVAWKDMAVMYRVNALSRVLEDALRNEGIPYVIARGTAFFDRAEIRDALAYLRLLANPRDEVSLRRIINTPTRGIGKTTVERLELWAYSAQCSLFDAVLRADEVAELTDRAKKALGRFGRMIESWRRRMGGGGGADATTLVGRHDELNDLAELVGMVIRESGLEGMHAKSKTEEDLERVANLEELVSSAAQFVPPLELGAQPAAEQVLMAWLESIALVSDADMVDPAAGAVTLLTLHAAKGLEFPVVCIAGLEEGLLPHFNAQTEAQVEEERRLCFVGITRAMRHLMLSSALVRTHRGLRERRMMSQFLRELPEDHIALVNLDEPDFDALDEGDDAPAGGQSRFDRLHHHRRDPFDAAHARGAAGSRGHQGDHGHDEPEFRDFSIGSKVRHPQFGIGRIESIERGRDHTRSKIAFAGIGVKTLILEYARLEAVE